MKLFEFFQSACMGSLLCTQVTGGDKTVPRPSDLGLQILEHVDDGWKVVTTTEGFSAKVYVCEEPRYIEIASVKNPTNDFKSYEALMSIWEHESKLTVASLDKIMYENFEGSDLVMIDRALMNLDEDPLGIMPIRGIEISKDSSDHAEIWDTLSATSFAQDAVEICNQFQDMRDRYIQSFKIGRYLDTGKWLQIVFATKSEQ
ncbi:hypothetical protein HOO65_010004 [Ceratocystis lukuohia]|uniref:Uncharacterized protein n=1 Tax=Ceratocystis lukuohia TaxID=2019550 RepID=A0ABR4MQV8_9PEZI